MTGSWQPDPTGRHELRWNDGVSWTDHVADAGATSTDPYVNHQTPPPPPPDPKGTAVFAAQPPAPRSSGPTSPTPPTPSAPSVSPGVSAAPSYLSGQPAGSSATSDSSYLSGQGSSSNRKGLLIGGAVLASIAIVVVVLVVFVFGGGDGGGVRTTTGEVGRLGDVVTLSVSGDEGDVILAEAYPDTDEIDAVVGLVLSRDQAADIYDEYGDILGASSFSEFLDSLFDLKDFDLGDDFEDPYFLFATDSRSTGAENTERLTSTLPLDGKYLVAAYALEGSGEIELSVEKCSGSIDLRDLLQAGDSSLSKEAARDACRNSELEVSP